MKLVNRIAPRDKKQKQADKHRNTADNKANLFRIIRVKIAVEADMASMVSQKVSEKCSVYCKSMPTIKPAAQKIRGDVIARFL